MTNTYWQTSASNTTWAATSVNAAAILSRIEGMMPWLAANQDSNGAMKSPYNNTDNVDCSADFALGAFVCAAAGNTTWLTAGINAMTYACANIGSDGNFTMLPGWLAWGVANTNSFGTSGQRSTWKSQLSTFYIPGYNNNWCAYSAAGAWAAQQVGGVTSGQSVPVSGGPGGSMTATQFIEYLWTSSTNDQQARFNSACGLYDDQNPVPLSLSTELAGRMPWSYVALVGSYSGASASAIRNACLLGGKTSLQINSSSGSVPNSGRTSDHVWVDAAGEVAAQLNANYYSANSNSALAQQFQRMANVGFVSDARWIRTGGTDPKGHSLTNTFGITKNQFNPSSRIGFQTASDQLFYNCANVLSWCVLYTLQTANSSIGEAPYAGEVGGYVNVLPSRWSNTMANAGGIFIQIGESDNGVAPASNYDQAWSVLGITRICRSGGWDERLGPADGYIANGSSIVGCSFGPAWTAGGSWGQIAGQTGFNAAGSGGGYSPSITTLFTSPLLTKLIVNWKGNGNNPNFSQTLTICPDGILSQITSNALTAGQFGHALPVFHDDGANNATQSITYPIASSTYGSASTQNFIVLDTGGSFQSLINFLTSYGNVSSVNAVSIKSESAVFVYPASTATSDPSASSVHSSFVYTPGSQNFSSSLGWVNGDLYRGRFHAGGFGTSIGPTVGATPDATFTTACNFILTLNGSGVITNVETDTTTTATINGHSMSLTAFTPATVSAPGGGAQTLTASGPGTVTQSQNFTVTLTLANAVTGLGTFQYNNGSGYLPSVAGGVLVSATLTSSTLITYVFQVPTTGNFSLIFKDTSSGAVSGAVPYTVVAPSSGGYATWIPASQGTGLTRYIPGYYAETSNPINQTLWYKYSGLGYPGTFNVFSGFGTYSKTYVGFGIQNGMKLHLQTNKSGFGAAGNPCIPTIGFSLCPYGIYPTQTSPVGNADFRLQDVPSGVADQCWRAMVTVPAAYGYKEVWYRLSYEDGYNTCPSGFKGYYRWNGNKYHGITNLNLWTSQFLAAFNHVANVIYAQAAASGITARLIFDTIIQNTSQDGRTAISMYKPPANLYDIAGFDTYTGNGYWNWDTNYPNYAAGSPIQLNATGVASGLPDGTQVSGRSWIVDENPNAVQGGQGYTYNNATHGLSFPAQAQGLPNGKGPGGGTSVVDFLNQVNLLDKKPLFHAETGGFSINTPAGNTGSISNYICTLNIPTAHNLTHCNDLNFYPYLKKLVAAIDQGLGVPVLGFNVWNGSSGTDISTPADGYNPSMMATLATFASAGPPVTTQKALYINAIGSIPVNVAAAITITAGNYIPVPGNLQVNFGSGYVPLPGSPLLSGSQITFQYTPQTAGTFTMQVQDPTTSPATVSSQITYTVAVVAGGGDVITIPSTIPTQTAGQQFQFQVGFNYKPNQGKIVWFNLPNLGNQTTLPAGSTWDSTGQLLTIPVTDNSQTAHGFNIGDTTFSPTLVSNEMTFNVGPAGTAWTYTMVLTNAGTSTIGSYWFAWVPGSSFLISQPTINPPTGWTSTVVAGNSGYSIQLSSTAGLAPGASATFVFQSSDSPTILFGNSTLAPGNIVATGVIYTGNLTGSSTTIVSSPSTPTSTTTVTVPVTSAAFKFSPGYWYSGTSRIIASPMTTYCEGAWFDFYWNAGPSATVGFSMTDSAAMTIAYSLNGAPLVQNANLSANIGGVIPNAANHVRVYFDYNNGSYTHWNVLGATLSAGSSAGTAPALKPWIITQGDSQTETYIVDYTNSWGYLCSQSFGQYDWANQSNGGSGWLVGGEGGSWSEFFPPSGTQRWNIIDDPSSPISILDSTGKISAYGSQNTTPAAIIVVLGINDALKAASQSGVTTAVKNWAAAARAATSSTCKLIILINFDIYNSNIANGTAMATAVKAGVTSANSAGSNVSLIDLGSTVATHLSQNGMLESDGIHLNASGNAYVAPLVIAQLQTILGVAPSPPTPNTTGLSASSVISSAQSGNSGGGLYTVPASSYMPTTTTASYSVNAPTPAQEPSVGAGVSQSLVITATNPPSTTCYWYVMTSSNTVESGPNPVTLVGNQATINAFFAVTGDYIQVQNATSSPTVTGKSSPIQITDPTTDTLTISGPAPGPQTAATAGGTVALNLTITTTNDTDTDIFAAVFQSNGTIRGSYAPFSLNGSGVAIATLTFVATGDYYQVVDNTSSPTYTFKSSPIAISNPTSPAAISVSNPGLRTIPLGSSGPVTVPVVVTTINFTGTSIYAAVLTATGTIEVPYTQQALTNGAVQFNVTMANTGDVVNVVDNVGVPTVTATSQPVNIVQQGVTNPTISVGNPGVIQEPSVGAGVTSSVVAQSYGLTTPLYYAAFTSAGVIEGTYTEFYATSDGNIPTITIPSVISGVKVGLYFSVQIAFNYVPTQANIMAMGNSQGTFGPLSGYKGTWDSTGQLLTLTILNNNAALHYFQVEDTTPALATTGGDGGSQPLVSAQITYTPGTSGATTAVNVAPPLPLLTTLTNTTIVVPLQNSGDYIQVVNNSGTPTIIGKSQGVTITDVGSMTPTLSISAPGTVNVAIGSSAATVPLVVSTTNVTTGTTLYWQTLTSAGLGENTFTSFVTTGNSTTINAVFDFTGDYVKIVDNTTSPTLSAQSQPIIINVPTQPSVPTINVSGPTGPVTATAGGNGAAVQFNVSATQVTGGVVFYEVVTSTGAIESGYQQATLLANGVGASYTGTITATLLASGDSLQVVDNITSPQAVGNSGPVTIVAPILSAVVTVNQPSPLFTGTQTITGSISQSGTQPGGVWLYWGLNSPAVGDTNIVQATLAVVSGQATTFSTTMNITNAGPIQTMWFSTDNINWGSAWMAAATSQSTVQATLNNIATPVVPGAFLALSGTITSSTSTLAVCLRLATGPTPLSTDSDVVSATVTAATSPATGGVWTATVQTGGAGIPLKLWYSVGGGIFQTPFPGQPTTITPITVIHAFNPGTQYTGLAFRGVADFNYPVASLSSIQFSNTSSNSPSWAGATSGNASISGNPFSPGNSRIYFTLSSSTVADPTYFQVQDLSPPGGGGVALQSAVQGYNVLQAPGSGGSPAITAYNPGSQQTGASYNTITHFNYVVADIDTIYYNNTPSLPSFVQAISAPGGAALGTQPNGNSLITIVLENSTPSANTPFQVQDTAPPGGGGTLQSNNVTYAVTQGAPPPPTGSITVSVLFSTGFDWVTTVPTGTTITSMTGLQPPT